MSIFGPLSGGTPATPAADSYSDPAALAALIQKQGADRRAYFDNLAKQLKDKRYGPSASERLLAISAALAAPTRTPGFGGLMSNVVPVFQQYEKDKRVAEEARASDMEKLGLARLGVGDSEIKTAMDLQELRARYNKPVRGVPVGERLVNPYTNEDIQPPVGTKRAFEGKTYTFMGGDQYDRQNWKEMR
jgi:hypothetical protein